jgi:hypothetical protein
MCAAFYVQNAIAVASYIGCSIIIIIMLQMNNWCVHWKGEGQLALLQYAVASGTLPEVAELQCILHL